MFSYFLDSHYLAFFDALIIGAAFTLYAGYRLIRQKSLDGLTNHVQQFRARIQFTLIGMFLFPFFMEIILDTSLFDHLHFVSYTMLVHVCCVIAVSIAAQYPVRKFVFEETWSFVDYFSFNSRLCIAFGGSFILLVFSPAIIADYNTYAWLPAIVLFSILLLTKIKFGEYFLRVLNAHPVKDPALLAEFQKILERSHANPPQIYVCGPTGSRMLNAVALPATTKNRVVFTESLLRHMTPEESAAIFAHEVAHLEDYNEPLLKSWFRHEMVWITGSTLGYCTLHYFAPNWADALMLPWIILLLYYYLGYRTKKIKALEVSGDERGVELCRNPQAFIRALTRLHDLNLMPRQSPIEQDKKSTHLSLARRITIIQNKAKALGLLAADESPHDAHPIKPPALPPPIPADTLIRVQAKNNEYLFMGPNHLEWIKVKDHTSSEIFKNYEAIKKVTHTATTHCYPSLVELRLIIKGKKHSVRWVDSDGTSKQVTIAPEDFRHVQQVIDAVDSQLAPIKECNQQKPLGNRLMLLWLIICNLGVAGIFTAIPASIALIHLVFGIGAIFSNSRNCAAAIIGASLWIHMMLACTGQLSNISEPVNVTLYAPALIITLVGARLLIKPYAKQQNNQQQPNVSNILLPYLISAFALILLGIKVYLVQIAGMGDSASIGAISQHLMLEGALFAGASLMWFVQPMRVNRGVAAITLVASIALLSFKATYSDSSNHSDDPLHATLAPMVNTSAGALEKIAELKHADSSANFILSPASTYFKQTISHGYESVPHGSAEAYNISTPHSQSCSFTASHHIPISDLQFLIYDATTDTLSAFNMTQCEIRPIAHNIPEKEDNGYSQLYYAPNHKTWQIVHFNPHSIHIIRGALSSPAWTETTMVTEYSLDDSLRFGAHQYIYDDYPMDEGEAFSDKNVYLHIMGSLFMPELLNSWNDHYNIMLENDRKPEVLLTTKYLLYYAATGHYLADNFYALVAYEDETGLWEINPTTSDYQAKHTLKGIIFINYLHNDTLWYVNEEELFSINTSDPAAPNIRYDISVQGTAYEITANDDYVLIESYDPDGEDTWSTLFKIEQ